MKKSRLSALIKLAIFISLFAALTISASAYEWVSGSTTEGELGNVRFSHSGNIGGQSKAFDTVEMFEDILDEINTGFNERYYYDFEVNLNGDMSVKNFDISKPHHSMILNLNGHTLTVTGTECYTYESLTINGGEEGGTVDFSGVVADHGDGTLFTIKECNAGRDFWGLNLNNVTIDRVMARQVFDIETPNSEDGITWNVSNVKFYRCRCSKWGGVFYINNSSLHDISFTDVNFIDVVNEWDGGAIYINNLAGTSDNFAKVNMTRCGFYDCKSPYGGAIFLNDKYVYLGNASSDSNDSNSCHLCVADECGGAIFDDEGYCKIQNFRFAYNEADGSGYYGGGAVHLDYCCTDIVNCGFFFNSAPNGHGGAINIYYADEDNNIGYSTFTGNSAHDGHPDVYNSPPTNGCIWSSTLKFSDASNYSGDALVKGMSPDDPILISNSDDLAALAVNLVSNDSETYNDRYYKLTSDVSSAFLRIKDFRGQLDFDGHSITTKLAGYLFQDGSPTLKQLKITDIVGIHETYENATSSVLSQGSVWIAAAVAAAAVIAVGAIVIVKKKKPAVANSAEKENEE